MDAPWGVCAAERQYRSRQASLARPFDPRQTRRCGLQLGWFVGVDWGSQTHQGLSEMADWLLSMAGGEAAAVGVTIEVPRGPVVESLMERGFVVHSINPK